MLMDNDLNITEILFMKNLKELKIEFGKHAPDNICLDNNICTIFLLNTWNDEAHYLSLEATSRCTML